MSEIEKGLNAIKELNLGPEIRCNRLVLYFSLQDRSVRKNTEGVFIEEIKREIRHLYGAANKSGGPENVVVSLVSDVGLKIGRMRFEFYQDRLLLFQSEMDGSGDAKKGGIPEKREWNALDILPEEQGVTKSILIVDDEPILCAVLQKMLSRLEYQVVTAHDGIQALRILAHMKIDLVISDIRMPRMDGWTLMQHVKRSNRRIPVVLITGYHSIPTQKKATNSEADGYIPKPFSFPQIKGITQKVLHH